MVIKKRVDKYMILYLLKIAVVIAYIALLLLLFKIIISELSNYHIPYFIFTIQHQTNELL